MYTVLSSREEYLKLFPTFAAMKSSTCMEGGRLVFCFLSLNMSLRGACNIRCCMAVHETEGGGGEEEEG